MAAGTKTANGLGMETGEAAVFVKRLAEMFILLPDDEGVFEVWFELVREHEVKAVMAHDTRLAAAMRCHGLTNLLTFNEGDFRL